MTGSSSCSCLEWVRFKGKDGQLNTRTPTLYSLESYSPNFGSSKIDASKFSITKHNKTNELLNWQWGKPRSSPIC